MHKYLLATALLFSGVLSADVHPLPGHFAISADYLFLMPSVDDTYFVLEAAESNVYPSGKRINNDLGFNSAFRVQGVYAFCSCDREFEVSYSRLSANRNKKVVGDFLWATEGRTDLVAHFVNYAGSAESKLEVSYTGINALLSQKFLRSCDTDISFKFGIEYAKFELDERNTYTITGGEAAYVKDDSHSWGVGPKVGFAVDYDFWQAESCLPGKLSLNVLTTAGLLACQTGNNQYGAFTAPAEEILLDVVANKSWRAIPTFYLALGLGYDICICGMETSLEVGYEFSSYFRGITRVYYPDDVSDALVTQTYNNFDMQGLYISLGLSF